MMVSINILFFLSKHKPSIYKALKAIRKILQETFYFWHCLQQPSRKFQQFHKDTGTVFGHHVLHTDTATWRAVHTPLHWSTVG